MKSKTHIYMANFILQEVRETGCITIPQVGSYRVPEDMKQAILREPAAFRAGSIGPDFYPDMIIGQTIIHPESSGKWLDIMARQLRMIPYGSGEWNASYAFYLGYVMHYAGDMFGHDYVNKWAHGSFPAIADAIKDAEKAKIIMRHILVESYMDERVPANEDMSIHAPISFLYKCFASPEAAALYPAEADKMNLLKWMINLKQSINEKSQDSNIRMLDLVNYFPSWESDVEAAITAWLVLWDNIAKLLLEPGGMSQAKNEIVNWFKDWGLKLTAIPKWIGSAIKFIGDILDALKIFEPIKRYLKEQLKDLLMQLVYVTTGIREEDIDKLIQDIKNIFTNPKLYLDGGILYTEKNITAQLDRDFGNYGKEKDSKKQTFLAFDQCLNMCRMGIIGADNLNQMLKPYYSGAALFSTQAMIPAVNRLEITITTSTDLWSGTDDNVYFGLVLTDNSAVELLMDKQGYNDFEMGDRDIYYFQLPKTIEYSQIQKIRLRKDYINISDDWKIKHITVRNVEDGFVLVDKELNVWLKGRTPYFIDIRKESSNQKISIDPKVMNHLYSLDGAAPAGYPDYKPWNEAKFFLNADSKVREKILIPVFKVSGNIQPGVAYCAHVANKGWLPEVCDGQTAGTTGESRQMEAVRIRLTNAPDGAEISYSAHVQNDGWLPYVKNGEIAGTTGKGKRMEAIKIRLKNLPGCQVKYRVHKQGEGWLNWVCDDEIAGSVGQSKRIEAVEIKLEKKG